MWCLSRLLINAGLLLFCCQTFAAGNSGLYPRTRVSFLQSFYSGEKAHSFAEVGSSFGGGITAFLDGHHFVPFFGFHAGATSGRQAFSDNSTEVTTSFSYYFATTDIGLQIYPIPRRTKGFNVYFTGAALIGYNFVSLSKSTMLTSIPYSDQSFSGGYAVGMGSEWILNNANTKKWTINAEVLFKKENATLFKSQFDLSSMIFTVGLGW